MIQDHDRVTDVINFVIYYEKLLRLYQIILGDVHL